MIEQYGKYFYNANILKAIDSRPKNLLGNN